MNPARLLCSATLWALVLRLAALAQVDAIEQPASPKHAPILHLLGRDWDGERIEMFLKVDPATGFMDCCKVRYLDRDRQVLSTTKNSFFWDGRSNRVDIQDGPALSSVFNWGDFTQGIARLEEALDGKMVSRQLTNPSHLQITEVSFHAETIELVCQINPQTRLPINLDITRGKRFGPGDLLKSASEIKSIDGSARGLFDFTIPPGATIATEIMAEPLRGMPPAVLSRCGDFHLASTKEADRKSVPVNTKLYFLDDRMNLWNGGFLVLRNDSDRPWEGETSVCNVDLPNMALFDAASGKKQEIRLVQHRHLPPGRFRLLWRLDEPLRPGQTRYGIYWVSQAERVQRQSTDDSYRIRMRNRYGRAAIENLMLILPAELDVADNSRTHQAYAELEGCRVYVWTRNLAQDLATNQVDVSLSRSFADYSDEYIRRNRGSVLIEIPEMFELANIAIAISEPGLKDLYKVDKSGAYYQSVLQHFLPFRTHPLLAQPSLQRNNGYFFRDNSVCYTFDGDRIIAAGPYRVIRNPDLFYEQRALVEDFARVSGFRQFYRDHLPFYDQQIGLYRNHQN